MTAGHEAASAEAVVAAVAKSCPSLGKSVSDVFGLIVLGVTTIYIGYRNSRFRGVNGKTPNFCGENEQTMLSLFVNLFATVAYFGRVVANGACEPGFPIFTEIKYLDYLIVCPLLVLDLLWNLESPYKFSCSALMLVTMFHGVAACNADPPLSYVWFGAGCFIFLFAYTSIVYLVQERLKHFNNCAVDAKASEAVFLLKFACCCFFFVWIWYPLVFILSPRALGYISADNQDIVHMILDCLAKSLYGVVSIGFRARFDKSILRTIDEEEYVEFSKRSPKRREITMKISVGGNETGESGFKIQLNEDPDTQSMADQSEVHSLGVSRQFVKSAGLVQPHDIGRRNGAISEDGSKAGSRLLFPSNRRTDDHDPMSGGTPRLNFQQIRFEGREFGQSSDPHYDFEDKWLSDLGQHLEDHGLSRGPGGVVEDVVSKLRGSGMGEQHLREAATEEELRALAIPMGARKLILRHYGRGSRPPSAAPGQAGPAGMGPDPFNSPRRVEQERWLAEVGQHLEELGLGRGVVEDSLGKLRRAGITEAHLRGAGTEDELREAGLPVGARKAILRRHGRPTDSRLGHHHHPAGGAGGAGSVVSSAPTSPRRLPADAPSSPRRLAADHGSPRYPEERWLSDLGQHLEEQGLSRTAVVDDTLAKLRGGGLSEERLRDGVSEGELKALGVPMGARKAILRYFSRAASPPPPASPRRFSSTSATTTPRILS